MLFGSEKTKERILEVASLIAKEQGFKLVYGAVLGSISRGIPGYDSDYDLRFLYVRDDFPNRLYRPSECSEKEIVYRHIVNSELINKEILLYPYDKIAFWELSSFISFLNEPSIGNETKNKSYLYYVTEHTFLSPYIWDPYGIQVKVMDFLFRNHKSEYSLEAYKQIIRAKYSKEGKEVFSRGYLTSIWAALSICWLKLYGGPVPVDFWQLLQCVEDKELKEKMVECNEKFYVASKEMAESMDTPMRKASKTMLKDERIKEIDGFIEDMLNVNHIVAISGIGANLEAQQSIDNILYSINKAMDPKEIIGIY